jgi:multidrug resistance efflux pump
VNFGRRLRPVNSITVILNSAATALLIWAIVGSGSGPHWSDFNTTPIRTRRAARPQAGQRRSKSSGACLLEAQIAVQQAQIGANEAQVDRAQAALVFAQQQASRYGKLAQDGWGTVQNAQQYTSQLQQEEAAVRTAQESLALVQRQIVSPTAQRLGAEAGVAQAKTELRQAQVNFGRTRILSPVDGYVTNLLAQLGDYVNVGVNTISVVDAHSFWIDGYFEETNIAPIRVGDRADIKLMGYGPIVRGHVDSIAREINVENAQPNGQGIATVNPIFTWVRLAQRIPVRISIDQVPAGIVLVAGMTGTVQIDEPRGRQQKESIADRDRLQRAAEYAG